MTKVCEIQVEGPLAPFAAGLEEALVAQSYSKNWALQLMALAAEVSHWLQRRGLGVNDLSEEVIVQVVHFVLGHNGSLSMLGRQWRRTSCSKDRGSC